MLIPTLLEIIRRENSLAQRQALLTLHHVVKALASKRLAESQRVFRELTASMFNFILNLWNTYTESFLIMASNEADASQIQEALAKALLLLRILRQLIVYGFSKPSESQDAMLFLKAVFERARTCLECRKYPSNLHSEENVLLGCIISFLSPSRKNVNFQRHTDGDVRQIYNTFDQSFNRSVRNASILLRGTHTNVVGVLCFLLLHGGRSGISI